MTTIEQQIRTQAADQDFQVLIEESMMVVTGTKLGNLTLECIFEESAFVAYSDKGEEYRTSSDSSFRAWLSNQYTIETSTFKFHFGQGEEETIFNIESISYEAAIEQAKEYGLIIEEASKIVKA
jgi:hypothetical protein